MRVNAGQLPAYLALIGITLLIVDVCLIAFILVMAWLNTYAKLTDHEPIISDKTLDGWFRFLTFGIFKKVPFKW